MIYVIYLILAAGVVFFSNKAAVYVDMLEERTRLSGAFLGGVMLSAVTSLPELFTSLSATIMLGKPGLCMGNILGSDIFNSAVLAVLMLLFYKSFSMVSVSRSHPFVAMFVVFTYIAILLNFLNILNFEIITINITSIILVVMYIWSVKYMSDDNAEAVQYVKGDEEKTYDITLKQLVTRLVLVCIGIVVVSIIITKVTDIVALRLHLDQGLAGAILLGVATSLPELASTTKLFQIGSYNIAIGNIIGSNMFNFIILFLADVFYLGKGLYDFSDHSTVNLLVFGLFSAISMLVILKFKNRVTQVICPLACLACYVAFLLV
ncbi:MAG: sodium:calcium antiporter [Anaerovoracaceae bacterium]|jgi:cation:H+ antiporter